jgi:hypothetical protein
MILTFSFVNNPHCAQCLRYSPNSFLVDFPRGYRVSWCVSSQERVCVIRFSCVIRVPVEQYAFRC